MARRSNDLLRLLVFGVEGSGAVELHEDRPLVATGNVGLILPSVKGVVGHADIGADALGGLVEFVELLILGIGDGFVADVEIAIAEGERQGEVIPFAGL